MEVLRGLSSSTSASVVCCRMGDFQKSDVEGPMSAQEVGAESLTRGACKLLGADASWFPGNECWWESGGEAQANFCGHGCSATYAATVGVYPRDFVRKMTHLD